MARKKNPLSGLHLPEELGEENDIGFFESEPGKYVDAIVNLSDLLWRQIDRINRFATFSPYTENFIMGVEMLDNMLSFVVDEGFQEELKNIRENYNLAIKRRKIKNNPVAQHQQKLQLANSKYRLVIQLMKKYGMLPLWSYGK